MQKRPSSSRFPKGEELTLLEKVCFIQKHTTRAQLRTTGVINTNQHASIGGSVAAAHFIRSVAPLYAVPVVLHTVR